MNFIPFPLRIFLSIHVCLTIAVVSAQTNSIDTAQLSIPGPANQDTTKFVSFYVTMHANNLDMQKFIGFFLDNQLMVRVVNNNRYIIKYPRAGNIEVIAQNNTVPKSTLLVNTEPGKNYYIRIDTEDSTKIASPKLILMDEKEGKEVFDKMTGKLLFVYDPDPLLLKPNPVAKPVISYYVWTQNDTIGFEHMKFDPPLSARHYFVSRDMGFVFGYYNKIASPTFSEVIVVKWLEDRNFGDAEDFKKYISKQKDNLEKGFKKSETLKTLTQDSVISNAEYTGSIYLVTEDTKPDVTPDFDTFPPSKN